jgi:phenylalanyl-tRNA synthetase beta chain
MLELRSPENTYEELPKFPATTRDLSLICDESLPAGKIEAAIRKGAGKLLEEVKLFDVYQGEQIEKGRKSISYSVRLRSKEATLTDEQTETTMNKVLKALKEIGAELRM